MTETVKITAARQDQSKADKASTLDLLRSKRRKTRDLVVEVNGEPITLQFQSISASELDKLRGKHIPTTKQRAEGIGVNMDTFAPALVAATLVDPPMTEDEVRELWNSDYWSTGELGQLFATASDLCMEGMDIPRSASV
jgi:hypothetical protein